MKPGSDEVMLFSILDNYADADSVTGINVPFAPNNHAWIMITKNEKKGSGDDSINLWTTRLEYQSTLKTDGYYGVSVIFETFDVYHYEETTLYDRWESVSDIGGFAFFMYILHAMFMSSINIFLENDSVYLGAPKKEYQAL